MTHFCVAASDPGACMIPLLLTVCVFGARPPLARIAGFAVVAVGGVDAAGACVAVGAGGATVAVAGDVVAGVVDAGTTEGGFAVTGGFAVAGVVAGGGATDARVVVVCKVVVVDGAAGAVAVSLVDGATDAVSVAIGSGVVVCVIVADVWEVSVV